MRIRSEDAACKVAAACPADALHPQSMRYQFSLALLDAANVHLTVEDGKPLSVAVAKFKPAEEGSFLQQPHPPAARVAANRLEWLAYLQGTFLSSADAAHTWDDALKQVSSRGVGWARAGSRSSP
jgi:hypothetical protein